jgi:hypothetical protein
MILILSLVVLFAISIIFVTQKYFSGSVTKIFIEEKKSKRKKNGLVIFVREGFFGWNFFGGDLLEECGGQTSAQWWKLEN